MESAQEAYDRWEAKLSSHMKHEVRVGSKQSWCPCFTRLRVRSQLLLSYGLATIIAYVGLCLLCILTTGWIRIAVVDDSTAALTNQVVDNSRIVLQEATAALEAKLAGSLATLVAPVGYALKDKLSGASSLSAVSSFSDGRTTYLKAPLVTSPRYTCDSSLPSAAARGCRSNGRQEISLSASSLYVQGSNPSLNNGFGTRSGSPSASPAMVAATSLMDFFVKGTWSAMSDSVDVFMALAGQPGQSSLFRQYPGAVGDLTADSGGYRTYDPVSRSWYTRAAALHTSSSSLAATDRSRLPPRLPMSISPPYSDAFGRGYMLTLSTLLVDEAGALLGIAGTDLHLASLREMVTFITSRETGEAHLFHIASDVVVASRQFAPPTPPPSIGSLTLPGTNSLRLGAVSPTLASQCSSAASGSFEWSTTDGRVYQFVWLRVFGDGYCLVTVTPTEEIQRPIASQLGAIDDTANRIIVIVAVVSAICLAVVLSCVVIVSVRLARPLVNTATESTKIVRNLGGDLFDGVKVVPPPKQGQFCLRQLLLNDPGEVASLRTEFIHILQVLMAKRKKKQHAMNPLYGLASKRGDIQDVGAQARGAMAGVNLSAPPAGAAGETHTVIAEEDKVTAVHVTRWNKIASQFLAKLLLPLMVGLVFIIIYNSVMLMQSVDSWTEPVRATMVKEEFMNLDVRAFERANFVEQYLAASIGSLAVVHTFANQLLVEGSVPYDRLQTSYFSPTSLCGQAGVTSTTASNNNVTCTQPVMDVSTRHPMVRANYASSVVYAPPTTLPSAVKDPNPGSGATVGTNSPPSSSAFIREQQLNSQLDNAFRAAYFGSDITYAYIGYHETEAYRQFPYMRLESFNYQQPKPCDVSPQHAISAWTPLCREWYKNAVDSWRANGNTPTTVFNPVASDAVSAGELFLSLSKALTTSSGQLIGVVAVDVALADMTKQIGATQLYQRGFAFIWDANGKGVVHKNYKKESNVGRGPIDISRLDAGSDDNFRVAFESGIVSRGRVTGNWSNYWHNPATGVDELWFYSFTPIHGTPYMLALTVVDQEVTAVADEQVRKLRGWVVNLVIISVFLCLLALLALTGFTRIFLNRFARPVTRLHDFVAAWGTGDYSKDIDVGLADSASSWELQTIINNLSKLLVALRFGNPRYSASTVGPQKELQNTLRALDILGEALRSSDPPPAAARGVGAVFNNLALASGNQPPESSPSSNATARLDPGLLFAEAVGNVKALLAEAKQTEGQEADEKALTETLAFRLLNHALWLVNEQQGAAAAELVREAVSTAPTLAALSTVASNLSCKSLCCGVGGEKDPPLNRVVQEAAASGLEQARKQPIAYESAGDFADVCVALCDLGCPSLGQVTSAQLAAWTLDTVPSISTQSLTRLALHAKELQTQGYKAALDEVMQSVSESWDPKGQLAGVEAWQTMTQGPKPKVVLFVLDLSYSMDCNNRLIACKRALLSVLEEHCGPKDRIGLITFADDVRYEFRIGPKDFESMQQTVNRMKTRGRTAFYSAVLEALVDLQVLGESEPSTPKWAIALTDGDDNKSTRDALGLCLPILSGTENLNLALITVGEEIRSTTGYDQLIGACKSSRHKNNGILINAANSDQISEAFGKVAAAMNAGVAEHL